MMDIDTDLLQWFENFFTKKLLVEHLKIKIFLIENQLKNYTNRLLKNSRKKKAHLPFIDSIWGADLADIQLINKFNKKIHFLLCVIGIYSKYA